MEEVTVTLSIEELNIVLLGLGELPAKDSMPVITKIHVQANEQAQAAAEDEKGA